MPSIDIPRDQPRADQVHRHETIGDIAAGVAHELRNPLLGISSAAQLLRFRAREDPVVEKNVGRILREVERLNRLASSLMDYGRPQPLRLVPADPDDIWDEVIEGNRGLLESRALHLERTRAASHTRVMLDAEQLAQAFREVLVNAIDAAPEATDLTLDATLLDDGAWRCRLANGGAALAADVLEHAFDVFYSTRPGGTGMGLPLCRRIIEDHRGTVALDAAPGGGAVCTIVLAPTPAT